MDNKFYFECVNCRSKYFYDEVEYLCPKCEADNNSGNPPKGVVKAVYNYSKILELGKYLRTFDRLVNTQFIDLFPLYSVRSFSALRIGQTPLYSYTKIDGKAINFKLFLKDESQNPTFSFKDRASNLVSAFALENDYKTIVVASSGNAGSSMAGIGASMQQDVVVFVPASAPKAKLIQTAMYGARIIPVAGTYDHAFELSIQASKAFGWYNRNTAYNPMTTEGKKTVSFEIFKQLNQELPDMIFVPVGDGSIISGVFKGFEDLLKLNIFEKMPRIVAVQAKGSPNLTNNLHEKNFNFIDCNTIADSLAVKIPRNFYMTQHFMNEYQGESVQVSDDEILDASLSLAKQRGIFSEPSSAAAYAGMLKYKNEGKIAKNCKVVVLLTGSGLKDIHSVEAKLNLPKPVEPTLDAVKKIIAK